VKIRPAAPVRRLEGASWLDSQVSPSFLFFWGLALAPSLALPNSVWEKALQAVCLAALALALGRFRSHRLLVASLVFAAFTVALNLLSPLGRVLARLGPVRVTEGALHVGLRKALTVLARSYLSRLCVRRDLSLPGAAGRYLRLTFGYLNALLAWRPKLTGAGLIGRIDAELAALMGRQRAMTGEPSRLGRTSFAGAALALAAACLIWLPAICRF